MRGKIPIIIIVSINIMVYLGGKFFELGNSNEGLLSLGAFSGDRISSFYEYYRVISCQFIHANIFHLLVNMGGLIYLYKRLNEKKNSKNVVLLYVSSVLFVGITLAILNVPNMIYIGNSGAVYALFSAYMYSEYKENGNKFNQSEWNLIFISLVVTFLPGVSVIMHISGVVYGVFICVIMGKYLKI